MTGLEHVAGLLEACQDGHKFRTVCSRAYYVTFRVLVTVCGTLGFSRRDRPAPGSKHAGVHRRLFDFMRESSVPVLKTISRRRIEDLYSLRIDADYMFGGPITREHAAEAVLLAQEIHDWLDESGLLPGRA